MIFHTESGSAYEIAGDQVRRINPDAQKRGDGEWQKLVRSIPTEPVIGQGMVLVMGSLARYGGDDYGTPPHLVDVVTTRRTTPVVLIEAETP